MVIELDNINRIYLTINFFIIIGVLIKMKKIVLIGAGSSVFGLGTVSDIFKSTSLEGSTIVLHDINSKNLYKTKEIAEKYKSSLNHKYKIEATTNRKEALKDADFCIISIEIGNRFDLWDQDWKIPLQYGIKQIYGENGGPGGLFHSLRIIPAVLEICEDINNICPDAFVFNYSNPMQRICHAVTTKFPEMKFVGLCHEIMSMKKQLPELMETDFSNIQFKAGGLNHLSILIEAKYKDTGVDGYPIIREKFENYYSQIINQYDDYHKSKPGGERGVFFQLYKDYGFVPITTDSHLGEYIQWAHNVADHDAINEFYSNYKKHCLSFHENTRSISKFFDPNREVYERVVPIIEAIENDSEYTEAAVNLPNQNFIDEISNGIVVEIPAIVNKSGLSGIKLKNYPSPFALLLNNQVGTIHLTTESVLNKSKHSAYLAMLADPVVDDPRTAERLLDTMIEVQEEYLGYLN